MNRRGFIQGLLAAVGTAATLDAEELLWIPGAKLISIPAVIAAGNGLTDGERYLCAAMGISELAFIMRRAGMHCTNPLLPPGYFRREQRGASRTFVGASVVDPVSITKMLFPERFQVA